MLYFQKISFQFNLGIVLQGKLLKLAKVLVATMLVIKLYLTGAMLNMLLSVKIYVVELTKIQISKKQLSLFWEALPYTVLDYLTQPLVQK